MIKKTAIIVLSLLFLIRCNGQEKKIKSNKEEEIFIGKTFFSGDELNNYVCKKSSDFLRVDSLSYSIYRCIGTNNYILSIEKIIQNDDVEKYQIVDTINFKNLDEIDFSINEIDLENKIAIKAFQKKHLLKEWIFSKKESSETVEALKSKLKDYKIVEELKCDLNKDDLEDLILIFEPKVIKKLNLDENILDSPLYIMINLGNGKYKPISNKKIIYTATFNCSSNNKMKVITEGNNLKIEQVTCDKFNAIQKDNITFNYNIKTNELTLEKFKRSLFDKLDNSEFLPLSLFLFPKDYNLKIKFQDFDSKIDYGSLLENKY